MKNWFSLRLYHWETNHSKGWVLCPAVDAQHKPNSAAVLEAVSQCCVGHFCFKPYSPLRVYYALQFCIFIKFLCANVRVSVSICFLSFFFGPFLPFVFFPFQFVFILSYCYSSDICFLRDRKCRLDGTGWSWRRGNHSQIICKKSVSIIEKEEGREEKRNPVISQEAWVSRGL